MNWIKGLLLLIVAAGVSTANLCAQPNIIFVMASDLGYADLSCYGQKAFGTPNLDLMSAEGMRFTQAYSGGTVGVPARSTLMTGTHLGQTPVRSDAGGVPLLDSDVTVAEVLKQAGYATGGFGTWGLGDAGTKGAPEDQGFDRFFGYYHQSPTNSYYPEYLMDTGRKVPLPGNKDFYRNNPGPGGMPDLNNGQPAQFAHAVIKREMFDWIRANKDRRFFCYAPWTPASVRREMPASDPAWQAVKDQSWSEAAKGHAAFTLMLDQDMADLFALLKELAIDESTIVFFCSDNGPDERYEGELNSSGPFRGSKGSLYEGGLRIPLIARWPGVIGPAQTCILPCYFPDVMPTLAELANVRPNLLKDLDGLSFVPVLLNQSPLQMVHDCLYWEYTPRNGSEGAELESDKTAQAVRIGNWKGVQNGAEAEIELYDLATDPGESIDLAAENPARVQEVADTFRRVRAAMRPQVEP